MPEPSELEADDLLTVARMIASDDGHFVVGMGSSYDDKSIRRLCDAGLVVVDGRTARLGMRKVLRRCLMAVLREAQEAANGPAE